jgi:hypothetical protein
MVRGHERADVAASMTALVNNSAARSANRTQQFRSAVGLVRSVAIPPHQHNGPDRALRLTQATTCTTKTTKPTAHPEGPQ